MFLCKYERKERGSNKMTQKSGLDAHIVRKYAELNTMSQATTSANDPDKIWGALGAMAMMNLASQQIKRAKVA
ncbi:MAG: hypothetical protein AB1782_17710 [Cyanobacteriota bacterium]